MTEETEIEGYASLFWTRDLNEDVTAAGAFAESLARTGVGGVKMLYQHEAQAPVGVWDEIGEDRRGLFVRGRILAVTPQARLVAALVRAGA
ncbi:MAG TPA: HK97 family phage prohead protease, partial [Caulobacteraceae bacterium]|nr:HK97 family phage prohead protease [Caulobacteraceae bacterium]